MDELFALPDGILALLAVLAVVQVGLEIWAVVDIVRRPKERILGENKLVWILVVLFVNLVGAIVYLVVGRRPAPVDVAPSNGAQATDGAIDTLYGPGSDAR